MKNGRSLIEIAQTLQSIRDTGRDIVVPAGHLSKVKAEVITRSAPAEVSLAGAQAQDASVEAILAGIDTHATQEAIAAATAQARVQNGLAITIQNGQRHEYFPSSHAHGQIAEYADIPREYYRRVLAENPALMATAINHGLAMQAAVVAGKSRGGGRMLRTHGGNLRGFVSSSYRTLDNFDLAEAVLPVMSDLRMDLSSTELTDTRLYFKALSDRVQGEVKKGDVVQYGLVVSNSDVGAGSVRVEPLIYRLVCRNGMVMPSVIRQAHLGRNVAGEGIEDLLSDSTKELNDKAFWNTVRDVVRNSARPEVFEAELNKLRAAEWHAITNFDLPEIVERTLKSIKVNASENVRRSILDNLASGADGAGMNKWGLANAVTYAAGSVEELDYDTATELERAGSKIIELSAKDWSAINAK